MLGVAGLGIALTWRSWSVCPSCPRRCCSWVRARVSRGSALDVRFGGLARSARWTMAGLPSWLPRSPPCSSCTWTHCPCRSSAGPLCVGCLGVLDSEGEDDLFFEGLDAEFLRELANPTYPPLVRHSRLPRSTSWAPRTWSLCTSSSGSSSPASRRPSWDFCSRRLSSAPALAVLASRLVAPRVVGRHWSHRPTSARLPFRPRGASGRALAARGTSLAARVGGDLSRRGDADEARRPLLAACVVIAALTATWGGAVLHGPGFVGSSQRLHSHAPLADLVHVPRPHGRVPGEGGVRTARELRRAWPSLVPCSRPRLTPISSCRPASRRGGDRSLVPRRSPRAPAASLHVVYLLAIAGFTWALWSFTEFEVPFVQDEGVNFVVRLSGALVILSAALFPLLSTRPGGERVASPGAGLTVAHARSLGDRGSRCRGVPARGARSLGRAPLPVTDRLHAATDRRRGAADSSSATAIRRWRLSSSEIVSSRSASLTDPRDSCGRVRVAVDASRHAGGRGGHPRGASVGLEPTLEQEPQ